MSEGNDSIVAPPQHGESPQDIHAIDLGGEHSQREIGDIRGVLPMGVEVGIMSDGWVTGEGKHHGKTQRAFNVL